MLLPPFTGPFMQLWMVILRYFAGVMAWLIILLVNVALLGITLYCFSMAGLLGDSTFAQVGNCMQLPA